MRRLPYNKNLRDYSRDLRNSSTLGEVLLWKKLRAGGMMGYQFNRQKPVDQYIVDFYCQLLNLVIEIDGTYHNREEQFIEDEERQKILESYSLNFLRFAEKEVRNDMRNVLLAIENYILDFEEKFPGVKDKKTRY